MKIVIILAININIMIIIFLLSLSVSPTLPPSLSLPTFISLSPFSFLPPSYPNIYYNTANPWSVVTLRYFNPVGSHPTGLIGEDPNGIPNNLMPYVSQVSTYKSERTLAEI